MSGYQPFHSWALAKAPQTARCSAVVLRLDGRTGRGGVAAGSAGACDVAAVRVGPAAPEVRAALAADGVLALAAVVRVVM